MNNMKDLMILKKEMLKTQTTLRIFLMQIFFIWKVNVQDMKFP